MSTPPSGKEKKEVDGMTQRTSCQSGFEKLKKSISQEEGKDGWWYNVPQQEGGEYC